MRASVLIASLSPSLILIPAAAYAQTVPYNWSGFYAGVVTGTVIGSSPVDLSYPAGNAAPADTGYGFSGNDLLLGGDVEDPGLPLHFSLDNKGAVVGAEAGFNAQTGLFVYGLEGDVTAISGAGGTQSGQTPSGLTTVTVTTKLDSLSSIRARAGIAVDRVLLFATAGLAVGQTSIDTNLAYRSDDGKNIANAAGSSSGLVPGIIGGAGIEYAPNDVVSLKFEGLAYKLAGRTATATGSGSTSFLGITTDQTVQPYSATFAPTGVTLRAGLNFHF